MREPTSPAVPVTNASQQALIQTAFAVGETAAESLAHLVPALDRDRTEYAVATALLEEAWISVR